MAVKCVLKLAGEWGQYAVSYYIPPINRNQLLYILHSRPLGIFKECWICPPKFENFPLFLLRLSEKKSVKAFWNYALLLDYSESGLKAGQEFLASIYPFHVITCIGSSLLLRFSSGFILSYVQGNGLSLELFSNDFCFPLSLL